MHVLQDNVSSNESMGIYPWAYMGLGYGRQSLCIEKHFYFFPLPGINPIV